MIRSTNQSDVLASIIQLLINCPLGLNDETCFLAWEPYPPEEMLPMLAAGDRFVTVAVSDSEFDEDINVGAGQYTATENTGVVVTIFGRYELDRTGKAVDALTNYTNGMLSMKKQILRALLAADPQWNLQPLLRNFIQPRHASAPAYLKDFKLGALSIFFSVDFDWDLLS